MLIQPLIEAPGELTAGSTASGPIVLSTRVRLARNLARVPFPGWAKAAQQRDILSSCLAAMEQVPALQRGYVLPMDQLSDLEKQILVERHLISRELSGGKHPAAVVISRDQSCAVMINEEDHLRLQVLRGGLKFRQVWRSINEVDNTLEAHLDYAFSPDLGYLTACPTNVGTGLRASAMLHLPGLVLAGHMEKVIRMVNQVGVAVRGLFGEGTDATGSIFQISNQQTLGESEEEIIKRLTNILSAVIQQETNARQKLLEDNAVKLFDKMGRAHGILRQAHLINSEEAMNHLSLLRLAVDLGFLPETARPVVDRLFIEAQPGHVQFLSGQAAQAPARDQLRAAALRDKLSNLPALQTAVSGPA